MTVFVDDDGKAYQFYSSEENPTMHVSLLSDDYLHPAGKFQRIFAGRSMEAPTVFKHAGKYYLQYGGPGTEFSGYGDGVYVGDQPLGPFTYQAHNPFSYKPGGYARGAGHGSTFQDPQGNWWHTSTIAIGASSTFTPASLHPPAIGELVQPSRH